MNIERLKQEAEEYLSRQTLCSCDSVSYCNIKNLIVGFAESKEKRILELEKENVKLTNELTKMTNVASFQQSANMNRWAENKELKRQIRELKKQLKEKV
jgi:peptidoglycan hydrolase CwlO-like protein